jgi:hypothetical protein
VGATPKNSRAQQSLAGGRRAARCAGWREKQIESLVAGANVGDHKPLLTVVMRRFDADLNKSD